MLFRSEPDRASVVVEESHAGSAGHRSHGVGAYPTAAVSVGPLLERRRL
jgi:hypothetical protein